MINSCNINFKGYDAAPLRAIYHNAKYSDTIIDEMLDVANKENISICLIDDDTKWSQDDKSIIEKDGSRLIVGNGLLEDEFFASMKSLHGILGDRPKGFLTGGNTFIGKATNGKKWLIAGEDDARYSKEKIAAAYSIEPENIYFLPQQNYHLDMYLRPVGYPYILVNDPKLVIDNIDKLDGTDEQKEKFKNQVKQYYKSKEFCGYCSCDETVEKLEEAGFIPIRIAGDYGPSVNFMNGIVNKRSDGTMSYITNSSECKSSFYTSMEKIFKEDLRESIDKLDEIYFIAGKKEPFTKHGNYMMGNLKYCGGGIHCMSLEEPDFKMWA